MRPIDILKILIRYKWLVIAAVLIAAASGYIYSVQQEKVYSASITVLVGQNQGLAENLNLTTALQDVANSMSKMISSRTVAEKVVDDLNLNRSPESLLGNIDVKPLQQTQLINVTYSDTDPVEAARIANGFGAAFAELIQKTESSQSGLTAQVWQRAVVPTSQVSPKPFQTGVMAAFLGMIIGLSAAFILNRMDHRWRSIHEVEEVMGLPILGTIPEMTEEALGKHV